MPHPPNHHKSHSVDRVNNTLEVRVDWFQCIKDFFNNQSVGAFIGAFSAFILVVINDRRRDSVKIKNLRAEIEMCLFHAKGKLESVRNNKALMIEHKHAMPAPILAFNTVLIRTLTAEVLSRLTNNQRRAIDALCYTMESIDEILDGTYHMAKSFYGPLSQADRDITAERILIDYDDAIVNLKRLMEMCDNYVSQNYETILTKQYDRHDYEEK